MGVGEQATVRRTVARLRRQGTGLATKAVLDETEVFIITLGLSEVWYDEQTGEVFMRAVPYDKFDPTRHKFRMATQSENLRNLFNISALLLKHRPTAHLIFTLSPIPLTATFRPMSALVASSASKANLRSALDEFFEWQHLRGLHYYFPSYDIVLNCFNHQFMEDRRHVHRHVLDFVMAVFSRHYCIDGATDKDLIAAFRLAQEGDKRVSTNGHWSVPRSNLKWSKPGQGT